MDLFFANIYSSLYILSSHTFRCLYCYPLPARRNHQDNSSQASFSDSAAASHRSVQVSVGSSHHLIPDAATSNTFASASVPTTFHRNISSGDRSSLSSDHQHPHQQHPNGIQQQYYAGNYHSTSGSIASAHSLGSMGDNGSSPRQHHPQHHNHPHGPYQQLSDLPDTIGSTSASVASGPDHCGSASVASTTSAAQAAADHVAIEEALTRFDTDDTDLCDILAAMRRFPRSVRVQELGCEKLWTQSWDGDNSSAIGRVGGIPTIIDSMRHHAGSAHLQQCGCEALQNLAMNDYNREVIAEAGGILAVIDAMGRHWDVAGVQQCELL